MKSSNRLGLVIKRISFLLLAGLIVCDTGCRRPAAQGENRDEIPNTPAKRKPSTISVFTTPSELFVVLDIGHYESRYRPTRIRSDIVFARVTMEDLKAIVIPDSDVTTNSNLATIAIGRTEIGIRSSQTNPGTVYAVQGNAMVAKERDGNQWFAKVEEEMKAGKWLLAYESMSIGGLGMGAIDYQYPHSSRVRLEWNDLEVRVVGELSDDNEVSIDLVIQRDNSGPELKRHRLVKYFVKSK